MVGQEFVLARALRPNAQLAFNYSAMWYAPCYSANSGHCSIARGKNMLNCTTTQLEKAACSAVQLFHVGRDGTNCRNLLKTSAPCHTCTYARTHAHTRAHKPWMRRWCTWQGFVVGAPLSRAKRVRAARGGVWGASAHPSLPGCGHPPLTRTICSTRWKVRGLTRVPSGTSPRHSRASEPPATG